MSATTAGDKARIRVENTIACILEAQECLRPVVLRLAQRALTEEDSDDLAELIRARRALKRAHELVLQEHPNKREDGGGGRR